MPTPDMEIIDLVLTQAIERYSEMDADVAEAAIFLEWPEQTAVLLKAFMLGHACYRCGGSPGLFHVQRRDFNNTYIKPLCVCEVPCLAEEDI
jgi:hypothetical protein